MPRKKSRSIFGRSRKTTIRTRKIREDTLSNKQEPKQTKETNDTKNDTKNDNFIKSILKLSNNSKSPGKIKRKSRSFKQSKKSRVSRVRFSRRNHVQYFMKNK
jgi:hypothetical protein